VREPERAAAGDRAVTQALPAAPGAGEARMHPTRPTSRLAMEFANALNYKRFVDDRDADPANGSFMFGAKALYFCSLVLLDTQMTAKRAKFSEDSTAPRTTQPSGKPGAGMTVQETARQSLAKLCEGVRIGPELTELQVAAEGSKAGDRFYAALGPDAPMLMRAVKSKPQDVGALIALTNDSSNPYALTAALEVLSFPHVIKDLTVFGEPVKRLPPHEQAAMTAAFELVKCDFGANCGRGSPEVLIDCALSGSCKAETLGDVVKMDYERRETRPDWSMVESYRQKISESIREGRPWLNLAS